MESKKEQLITEVVYQGNHTYEIKKTIDGFKGDKAILIGLYPTVDGDNITKIDSTQLHLINHMKELGLKVNPDRKICNNDLLYQCKYTIIFL